MMLMSEKEMVGKQIHEDGQTGSIGSDTVEQVYYKPQLLLSCLPSQLEHVLKQRMIVDHHLQFA